MYQNDTLTFHIKFTKDTQSRSTHRKQPQVHKIRKEESYNLRITLLASKKGEKKKKKKKADLYG